MKKIKSDTASGSRQVFESIKLSIRPPDHCSLHPGAEEFYNAIVESRDKAQWNDVDLSRAVTLANYQAQIKESSEILRHEGDVIINERGTPIMNPRFTVVNTLTRLEISLSKALQTDAASTVGRSQDAAGRNKKAASMKRAVDNLDNDGLIPGVH